MSDDGEKTREVSTGVETGGLWEMESGRQGICDSVVSEAIIRCATGASAGLLSSETIL